MVDRVPLIKFGYLNMVESVSMRFLWVVSVIVLFLSPARGQENAKAIFDTEKAFERAVAEKGINKAFIEFMSPDGVMFMPLAVNAREAWSKRPESNASLTWKPLIIEVSANGAIGYSIGNSEYRANGKNDPNVLYGHYLSVWSRQPNGEYRAVVDAGIKHPKPTVVAEVWRPKAVSSANSSPASFSAGDGAVAFFSAAEKMGVAKAYGAHLADDSILMREGSEPFRGRKAAVSFLEKEKKNIRFARRKSFIEAGDLAYVYSTYSVHDKTGSQIGEGNYVQVWKLISGKWKIVAEIMLAIPNDAK